MGIDLVSLEAILFSNKYIKNKNKMTTLGRQQLHVNTETINNFLKKYNLNIINSCDCKIEDFCEKFFQIALQFGNVDSIDNSSYENASIIHNMNKPFNVKNKYNYIYDGGTIEHIFNIPQVLENIISLLEIDGIYCSVTCNNNFSGHGMYQFSPELFLSSFNEKYGMKIVSLYLARNHTPFEEWIDVNSYNGYRNLSKINTTDEIYIIVIAKKISDDRKSLVDDPPNQYNYEEIDWK